jgi:uncharacterized protein YndB with AHSA1/START domain
MLTKVSPLRREIAVAASPDLAFRVFVERIGQWWPLADHSVHGAGGSVSFEGDDIVEISADGERCVWGTVTARRPGEELAFTWHPGRDPEQATRVTVTFRPNGESTLVTLVHDGWEVHPEPAGMRANYGEGWPIVLGCFGDDAARAAA